MAWTEAARQKSIEVVAFKKFGQFRRLRKRK